MGIIQVLVIEDCKVRLSRYTLLEGLYLSTCRMKNTRVGFNIYCQATLCLNILCSNICFWRMKNTRVLVQHLFSSNFNYRVVCLEYSKFKHLLLEEWRTPEFWFNIYFQATLTIEIHLEYFEFTT